MSKDAGIPAEGITKHSLRATAPTRMMDAGLPEKVNMDHTGHHTFSLDDLKPYSQTTDCQQQIVSSVISGQMAELVTTQGEETTIATMEVTTVQEDIQEKVKRTVER